jgi:hypothetical protein
MMIHQMHTSESVRYKGYIIFDYFSFILSLEEVV